MKFKITEKGIANIVGKSDDGKTINISAYKNPTVFRTLRTKDVGHEFETVVETANTGRLYCAERIDIEKALFEAEKLENGRAVMQKQNRLLDAQLANAGA